MSFPSRVAAASAAAESVPSVQSPPPSSIAAFSAASSASSGETRDAARKRRREEPEAGTYEAFDHAFGAAIQEGITVSNCKAVFNILSNIARQIEVPAEKDKAFSKMADYLCDNMGLVRDDVNALWCEAASASTASKTTDYFVETFLSGARAMRARDPGRANTWIDRARARLTASVCTVQEKRGGLNRILEECGEERRGKLGTIAFLAERTLAELQGIQVPIARPAFRLLLQD